jgi:hypothetical protein
MVEVRVTDDRVVCDVCHRTMLKGERPEPYLAPSRERKIVCQVCAPRAQREGWIRESADPSMPVQPPRPKERRRLFGRSRRRLTAASDNADSGGGEPPETAAGAHAETSQRERPRAEEFKPGKRFMRDPRHVRAVPTSAQLKMERAIELFNTSEHPRTVAGIARSLGSPAVNVFAARPSAAEVLLTVAWEISWYQFVVDLSDTDDPVRMEARGHEVSELAVDVQDWNAVAGPEGMLSLGVPVAANGEDGGESL